MTEPERLSAAPARPGGGAAAGLFANPSLNPEGPLSGKAHQDHGSSPSMAMLSTGVVPRNYDLGVDRTHFRA